MTRVIDKKQIKNILIRLFKEIRVKKEIYTPVVEGLIETSLRGVDSHGIRLVPHYLRATLTGRINPEPKFKFKKTAASTMIMNADHTYGITAGVIAMEKAIGMAKKSGVGIVVAKNSSHFGAAGIFGLMAAKKNMIGMAMTHVEDVVVPYAGTKPFLGTNAICFAVPMEGEDPFILDMATTQLSLNKLKMFQHENKSLELGWAVDRRGKFTTDPKRVFALTHFGSYKGYGIALLVEILCSLLSGMPFGPFITHMFPLSKEKRRLGHFLMAIDISKFQPVKEFMRRMKEMANLLRKIQPALGFPNVRLAGDHSKREYKKRIKEGIPLTLEIIEDFKNIAKEVGVKINI